MGEDHTLLERIAQSIVDNGVLENKERTGIKRFLGIICQEPGNPLLLHHQFESVSGTMLASLQYGTLHKESPLYGKQGVGFTITNYTKGYFTDSGFSVSGNPLHDFHKPRAIWLRRNDLADLGTRIRIAVGKWDVWDLLEELKLKRTYFTDYIEDLRYAHKSPKTVKKRELY